MKRKTIERIPIEALDLSIVTPCRSSLRKDTVEHYAELLREDTTGWPFSTHIIVARVTGEPTAYVVDGLHRISASLSAGKPDVICSTYEAEDRNEIIREARCANAKHGEKLTREELRENLMAYFCAGGDKNSDTDVGLAFGINRKTVARIRAELNVPTRKEAVTAAVEKAIAENPKASVRELAKASGVSAGAIQRGAKVYQNVQNGQNDTLHPSPVTPPIPRREIAKTPTADAVPAVQVSIPKRETPKPPTDVLGHEIPPDMYEDWDGEREKVKDWLNRARAILREVKEGMGDGTEATGMRSLRFQQFALNVVNHLDCVISGIKDIMPEALCTCQGFGCRRCHMRGWMTEKQYRMNIPEAEQ